MSADGRHELRIVCPLEWSREQAEMFGDRLCRELAPGTAMELLEYTETKREQIQIWDGPA